MLLNTYFSAFGAFALYPWFLGSLWKATRRAEGEGGILAVVALLGGVGVLGPLLLQIAGWGAAAMEAGPRRDLSVATGLMDLGNMGFVLLPMPAAVLIAATTLASRRSELLPTWLTWAGLPAAGVLVVGGLIGFLPQLLFAVFALWLMAVALILMRRGSPDPLSVDRIGADPQDHNG